MTELSPDAAPRSRAARLLQRARGPQAGRWVETVVTLAVSGAIQLASFILLARMLGVQDYGVIVSIAAVVSVTGEFLGLGCGDMYIESLVKGEKTHAHAFAQAIVAVGATIVPVVAVTFLANKLAFEAPLGDLVILVLIVSELLTLRATAFLDHVAIAQRRLRVANVSRMVFTLLRLGVIVVASSVLGVRGIEGWWPIQAGYSAIVIVTALAVIARLFGRPAGPWRGFGWNRGFFYAGNQILRSLQASVDRVAIGVGTPIAVLGAYGTAQRMTQFATMPILAMLRITYPSMFEHGRRGILAVRAYSYRLIPLALALGLAIAAAFAACARPFATLLGPSFADVVPVMWALSVLPALAGVQALLGDILTGSNRNRVRTIILIAGVGLVAAGARLGLHIGGATGAALGAVAGNVALAVLLAAAIEIIARREASRVPDEARI